MRISDFEIRNFRGISYAKAQNLGSAVIIAGQNGSGKSCILDALRLIKSAYGGYQQNEWHHWMNEFAINMNSKGQDLVGIFNDPMNPVIINFSFVLHSEEKSYLRANLDDLLLEHVWRTEIPEAYSYGGYRMAMFAGQFREREPEMRAKCALMKPDFERELDADAVSVQISVQPGGRMMISNSILMPTIFTSYLPGNLGVLDYHGPQRHYGRDPAQSVSINLDQSNTANQSAHALYNYSNKYAGIKSEMAASYVKEILAEEAGIPRASQNNLTNTLKSLFENFFPDKRFLGPQPNPDGSLAFPVVTPSGGKHDLDELSSGEKEILYGYLRMRNSAPRFSVILIDEPELHLNPRLIRGLPQFYLQNLALALDNQIWLITHSDALLREAVGIPSFDVFHMQPCTLINDNDGRISVRKNQLKPLGHESDLDLAIADLVGDFAAYQPDRKVVIFEGGGESDFDKWMTATIFPKFAQKVNLISGTNKSKVNALHEILDKAFQKREISTRFFAITDSDYEDRENSSRNIRQFSWPVYHIENFLLDAGVISRVVSALTPNVVSEEEIADSLRECARRCIDKAVRHHMVAFINRKMVSCISLSVDPRLASFSPTLSESAEKSRDKISDLLTNEISLESLEIEEARVREKFGQAISNGSWVNIFPGRDILRFFANSLPNGIGHETLRNMIVNRMAEEKFEPVEMARIIRQIEADV